MTRQMRVLTATLGVALAILALGYWQCATSPDRSSRNLADFEAAWNRIHEVYPFFELKQIDWEAVHATYRPRVEAADEIEFESILSELLAELQDGHVYFRTAQGREVVPWAPPRRIQGYHSFSLPVVKSYFDTELGVTKEGGIESGILPDNIGYLYLSSMNRSDVAEEFPGILDSMQDTRGLILDIRTKRGGTIQNVEAIVSRFLTEPVAWPTYYFRGEPYVLNALQPRGPFTYTRPIVVLINGMTFSAGESTTEVLRQLPQVTVVGDTTGGGGGIASDHSEETRGNYVLPSGIMINIPTGYGLRPSGEHVEWLGVPPDIRVEQTAEDVEAGRDPQLERAIELLR